MSSSREQPRVPSADAPEQLRASLAEIARALSHDARAPLRAIDAFARFLTEDLGGPLPERAAEDLARLTAASARLQDQIERLVRAARRTLAEASSPPGAGPGGGKLS